MKHHRFKEIFTGRRNIFTATTIFIGGYFFAYPLVNLSIKKIGDFATMGLGLALLIVGDYIIDAFHQD